MLRAGSVLSKNMRLATRIRRRFGMNRRLARFLFKQDFFGVLLFHAYFDAVTLVMRRALLKSVRDGMKLCEIGPGAFAVLLVMLAKRFKDLELHGIELNPISAELARVNVFLNRVPVSITEDDFESYFRERPGDIHRFALVFCNMPYFTPEVLRSCNLPHLKLYEKLHEGSCHVSFLEKMAGLLRTSGYRGQVLLGTNEMYLQRVYVDRALETAGFRSTQEFNYSFPLLANAKAVLYAPVD